MGMIIEFKARGGQTGRATPPQGPAKIIIFNGVRIERMQERNDSKPAPRRPASRVANSEQA